MSSPLSVALVVPAHRGGPILTEALAAIGHQDSPADEVVVVADGPAAGADLSLAAAVDAIGARLEVSPRQGGPSAARNRGVSCTTAEVVLFVDSDVVLAPDVVGRVRKGLVEAAAVFGSYDDAPRDPAFTSQYKNLVHHLTHQAVRKAMKCRIGNDGVEAAWRDDVGEHVPMDPRDRDIGKPPLCPIQDWLIEVKCDDLDHSTRQSGSQKAVATADVENAPGCGRHECVQRGVVVNVHIPWLRGHDHECARSPQLLSATAGHRHERVAKSRPNEERALMADRLSARSNDVATSAQDPF